MIAVYARKSSALLALALALLPTSIAVAESDFVPPKVLALHIVCVDYRVAVDRLKAHKETLRLVGQTSNQSTVMELWFDDERRDWSVIIHKKQPVDVGCMLMTGEKIQTINQPPKFELTQK